jgi:hypothetical protein
MASSSHGSEVLNLSLNGSQMGQISKRDNTSSIQQTNNLKKRPTANMSQQQPPRLPSSSRSNSSSVGRIFIIINRIDCLNLMFSIYFQDIE